MTPSDVINVIEQVCASLPERMTGNEGSARVAETLRPIIASDRSGLVAALSVYLAWRVPESRWEPADAIAHSRLWLALNLAVTFGLTELSPAIELLRKDVRNGAVLLPVHEAAVDRYLKRLLAAT